MLDKINTSYCIYTHPSGPFHAKSHIKNVYFLLLRAIGCYGDPPLIMNKLQTLRSWKGYTYRNARLYREGSPLEGRGTLYISRLAMCNGTAASRLTTAEYPTGNNLVNILKVSPEKRFQVIYLSQTAIELRLN